VLSAIVIVEPERPEQDNREGDSRGISPAPVQGEPRIPLAFAEVLGQSVFARLIEELRRAGVGAISVYGSISAARARTDIDSVTNVEFRWTKEPWTKATQRLLADGKNGVEQILVVRVGAYVDLDLKDALHFHREQRQGLMRVFDESGPLDIWIVNPDWISQGLDVREAFSAAAPARYLARGYVNRLESGADLRRLAVDGLTSRCGLRPLGTESRPGVWMDNGAQVDRDCRIVAPAFIGRGTKIAAQCLITRCSNVESNCHIDYGTVVEDSSILSNSYVGIGLDVSHSIVDGSRLLNLERNVALEIADPGFIRQNKMPRQDRTYQSSGHFDFRGTQSEQVEEGLR
jgi:NDP-sugar pyrophosphorylase family protein